MWDKGQFKDADKFKITYRYNGVMREATVQEVRLSYITLYRMRSAKYHWDLAKRGTGEWYCNSPHQMKHDLLKIIGEAIDKVKE
jgi:hypothetical protein